MLICDYIRLVAIAEGEEDWGAAKIERLAEATFEITFVAPVKEAEVAAVNDEPWWASIGLNHVAKFRMGILETGRWVASDGIHQELI